MIKLPYGKTFMELHEDVKVITPSFSMETTEKADGKALVEASMKHPFGGVTLAQMAAGCPDCTLILSDHTRPVPSRDILPQMLRELYEGNPQMRVTMLVATGLHRPTTAEELSAKLGTPVTEAPLQETATGAAEAGAAKAGTTEAEHRQKPRLTARDPYGMEGKTVRILIHDGSDPERNVFLGTLPSGAPLYVDRAAAEASLLAAEGFIEPHFFAGFSGGRKSVLPGVSGRLTVLGNHCGRFIADPHARTGRLEGNPIDRDMKAAAEMAGLRYITNVVINEAQQTVAAFSGEPGKAHEAGCALVGKMCRVTPDRRYDIVITTNGGAPLDQNIYQCVKSMTAAEAACRKSGVIIECAECADGIGGDSFYRSLSECRDAASLYEEYCAVPQDETIPDQWQSQILARVLAACTVIFVTRPELRPVIEDMKMRYAGSVQEALALARGILASEGQEDPAAAVIPNGISVIVEPE